MSNKYPIQDDRDIKYIEVITLTVCEINRVLAVWKANNKNYSLVEVNSLGLTYLAKIVALKFGWGYWKRILKSSNPTFIIENNKVKKMHCMRHMSDLVPFARAMESFDYENYKLLPKLESITNSNLLEIDNIDFKQIENIKF